MSLNERADTPSSGYLPAGSNHALAFDLIITHSDNNPLKVTFIFSWPTGKTAGVSTFKPLAIFLSRNKSVKNSDDFAVGWSPLTLSKFLPMSSSQTSITAIVALY